MCYAIPGKVKALKGKTVVVDYFGQEKQALNEFYDLKVGDYISAQGGFVIKKVPPREAEETLSAWGQLFFELQDLDLRLSRLDFDRAGIDKKLAFILDQALEGVALKQEDLLYLLNLNQPRPQELLFKTANFLRQKYHQNSCCVHGVIEISNFCRCTCVYCGISTHNKPLKRYRMSPEEIVDTACRAVADYGFQALVLQSGEDPFYSPEDLADIIKTIKERQPVLICISFGEIGLKGLEKLYAAGARGLLMRFETANPVIFQKLHPGRSLDRRLAHIRKAGELGYIIMTGGLIGLPGQTKQDMIKDVYLAKNLGAEMYSFGPFLPHPQTPLGEHQPPREEDILKVLSLTRLVDPQ